MPEAAQNPSFNDFMKKSGIQPDPDTASTLENRRKKAEEALAPTESASFTLPPKPVQNDPFQVFGSSAGWIAAFGSLLTKHPLQAALTASAGAMEASKLADKDAYKKSVDQWKENNTLIMDRAKFELEAYKNATNDAEWHLLAQAYGNPTMTTMSRLGMGKEYIKDHETQFKMLEKHVTGAMNAVSEKMEVNSYVKDKVDEYKKANPTATHAELDKAALQFRGEAKSLMKGDDPGASGENDYEKLSPDAKAALDSDAKAWNKGAHASDLVRGYGKQAAKRLEMIKERAAQLEAGVDRADSTVEYAGKQSESRALGTQTAKLATAGREADNLGDLLVTASADVPRSSFPKVNEALLAFEKGTGDPKVVAYGAALNSYINAYARAINPTGQPRISDKDHARDMLSEAFSDEQVKAVVAQLKKETQAAREAPEFVKKSIRGSKHSESQREEKTIDGADYYKEGGTWYHAE